MRHVGHVEDFVQINWYCLCNQSLMHDLENK